MHNPVTDHVQQQRHLIQTRYQAFNSAHSPDSNTRPHRDPREYLQRQSPAPANRIISTRVGAPTALTVQQARQTARAVRDGEESNHDVDDEVDGDGSGRFVGAEAAEVVGREEEGEERLWTNAHRIVKEKTRRRRRIP